MKNKYTVSYPGTFEIHYYTIAKESGYVEYVRITQYNKDLTEEIGKTLGMPVMNGYIPLTSETQILKIKEYLIKLPR